MQASTTSFPPDPLPPVILGGTINLVGGSPFTGKTPLLAWLLRQFLAGNVLGHPVPPGAVPQHAVICADRSWSRSGSVWFRDFPSLRAYGLQDDLTYKKQNLRRKYERTAVFEHCLEQLGHLPRGTLVWVDPLSFFLGGNLLDPDGCMVACSELREICLHRGLTVIGTAHAAKQKANPSERYLNLLDRIAGSVSLFGYTDTAIYLASPQELDRQVYTLALFPRLAPRQSFDLVQDPKTGEFQIAPLGAEYSALVAALPLEPGMIAIGDLRQMLCPSKMSRATLFRQLRQLQEAGEARMVRHGQYQRRRPS